MYELIDINRIFKYHLIYFELNEYLFISGISHKFGVSFKDDYFIRNYVLPYDKTTKEYQDRIHRNYNCMKFIIDNDCLNYYQDFCALSVRLSLDPDNVKLNREYDYITDIIHYIDKQTNCVSLWVYTQFFRQARKKIARIEERLNSFRDFTDEDNKLYFCTITLDPKKWNYNLCSDAMTSEVYDKIRRKLREHIKEYSDLYLFNKDFGLTETRRLHFHGVALVRSGLLPSLSRNSKALFGISDFKEIDDRSDYISRYIEKLSFHALKVNYGKFRENLIYSRKVSI